MKGRCGRLRYEQVKRQVRSVSLLATTWLPSTTILPFVGGGGVRHQYEQIDDLMRRQAGPQKDHAGTSATCRNEFGQHNGQRAEVVGDDDSLLSGGPLDDLKVVRAQRRRPGIANA